MWRCAAQEESKPSLAARLLSLNLEAQDAEAEEGLLPAQRLLVDLLARCCVANEKLQRRLLQIEACHVSPVLRRVAFVRRHVFGASSRVTHLLPWVRLLVETAPLRATLSREAQAVPAHHLPSLSTFAPLALTNVASGKVEDDSLPQLHAQLQEEVALYTRAHACLAPAKSDKPLPMGAVAIGTHHPVAEQDPTRMWEVDIPGAEMIKVCRDLQDQSQAFCR